MNRFRRIGTVSFLLLAGTSLARAQVSASTPAGAARTSPPRTPAALTAAAREIIHAAKYAALITVDSLGRPQARTVEPFDPDSQMVVWFATNPRTRKVEQIRRNPHVSLYYFDPATLAYVTVIGTARLVNDAAEKKRRWKPEWQAFYPDRDKGFLLVAVTPERLEVVNTKLGITGDAATWRPPSVDLRTKAPTRP